MATLEETVVVGGATVRGLNGRLCTTVDVCELSAKLETVDDARGCSCTEEVEGVTLVAAATAANFAILSSKLLRTFSSATSLSDCGMVNVRCFNLGEEPETDTPASVDCAAPKRCFAQSTRDVGDAVIFPTVV